VIIVDTFVAGRPRTKGSLTFVTPTYAKDSEASRHWRALMAGAVLDSRNRLHAERTCTGERGATGLPIGCSHASFWPCGQAEPYAGPVGVRLVVGLPVDPLEHGAGDLDKLLRNVLDAIASNARNPRFRGGAIIDDNQVTWVIAEKWGPAKRTGVQIVIETLDTSTPTVLQ
jgi:hypothetical protein